MRTLRYIFLASVMLVAAFSPSKAAAQVSLNSYFNVDWQFNIPLGNSFSNDASGWEPGIPLPSPPRRGPALCFRCFRG